MHIKDRMLGGLQTRSGQDEVEKYPRNLIPVTQTVAYSMPTEIFWLLLQREVFPQSHNFTIKHTRL